MDKTLLTSLKCNHDGCMAVSESTFSALRCASTGKGWRTFMTTAASSIPLASHCLSVCLAGCLSAYLSISVSDHVHRAGAERDGIPS